MSVLDFPAPGRAPGALPATPTAPAALFPSQPVLEAPGGLPGGGPGEGLRAQEKRLNLLRVDDTSAVRQAILERVRERSRQMPPVEGVRHSLRFSDIDYQGPERYSLAQQKEAVLRGRSLERPLRGTVELVENEGGKVADSRRVTFARVPYLTERGTFIVGGVEHSLASQMRLRPGVFTRRRDDGEVEAHVNVLPGQGRSHHLLLEPDTGLFRLAIGTTRVPLFPILEALGVPHRDLEKRYGSELAMANAKAPDSQALDKLANTLLRAPREDPSGEPPDEATRTQRQQGRRQEAIQSLLSSKLDPRVTQRTLGQPFTHVGPEMYLSAMDKILAVHQGKAPADDRDHMAYQRLLGPDDLFAERINLAHRTLKPLLRKVSMAGNLEKLLPGFLDRHLHAVLSSSGLANPLEEVNPADNLDQLTRVSRMGYGAISSTNAIPAAARDVQPSHLGFIDYLRTPESNKAGVDVRLATAVRRGPDGEIYAPFQDRQGRLSYQTPHDVADKTIAFPGELERAQKQGRSYVATLQRGELRYAPIKEVDYSLPSAEDSFNHLSNLIPGKSGAKGQRVMMGGRMLAQALPLENPEAPLIQSGVPWSNNRSYEEEYADRMGAVFAKAPGTVHKITPDGIHVRHDDGTQETYETYNWHPLNRITSLHNTSNVEVGQRLKRGDLLARSNFTDEKGTIALGTNLRTAYMPARGHSFEDAVVISESAAKKLSSSHLQQHELPQEDGLERGKKRFQALFPGHFQKAQLEALDDDGVAQVGSTVAQGDPLILASRRKELRYGQLSRSKSASMVPEPLTWEEEEPGIVTDVTQTRKGTVVTVRSIKQMQEGDKMSGRVGDKGVVGKILPDEHMPQDGQGRPLEVLFNPLGVVTRVNPIQVVEAALGKIARARGQAYKIKDFGAPNGGVESLVEFARQERAKYGIPDKEDLHDPQTDRKIPQVLTGERFFMKLEHVASSKGQGRSTGGYASDDTPARGGTTGGSAKKLSLMESNALLSHGALDVLRDKNVRGQKNLDYWAALLSGKTPPPPSVPQVHQKFFSMLQSAGVRVRRDGPRLQILAMTAPDVQELSGGRELENVETVDWKHGLKPIAGGLFDEALTGGHGGKRFAQITLQEPLPNPAMEEPIRRILGLTGEKFRQVLSGKEKLGEKSGPGAIQGALENMNLEKELAQARLSAKSGSPSSRDAANRRLFFLEHASRLGQHPRDWILPAVPVLPPAFRPVSVMSFSGKPLVADPNYLYKELFEANQNLKGLTGKVTDTGEERLAVYDAFKGVVGLGEPLTPKNVQRKVKGLLHEVFGESSKHGMLQQKLVAGTVDTVGRAVIAPDPDLDMDSIGLPENKAWDVYRPFVVRRLVRRGVTPVAAAQMIEDKTDLAKKMLEAELQERPVIATRAPVLHRYGVMAFWPRLVKGDTLRISPLVCKSYGGDFDGDQMNYHVPVSEEAVHDALDKMLPSRNLLAVRDFQVHQMPRNEFQGGLFEASSPTPPRKPGEAHTREHVFQTTRDVIQALRQGKISATDKVMILEHKG